MPWLSSAFPRLTDVKSIFVEGIEGGRERSWQTGFTEMGTPRYPGEFLSGSGTEGLNTSQRPRRKGSLNRPMVLWVNGCLLLAQNKT